MADIPQRPSTSSGWLGGLFSWAPALETRQEEANDAAQKSDAPKEAEPEQPAHKALAPVEEEESAPATASQRAASYLSYLWPNKAPPENGSDEEAKEAETAPVTEDTPMEDAPLSNSEPASEPSAGSTWAFWSVFRPKPSGEGPRDPEIAEAGEMAVLGEGSERHPKRTHSADMSREASAEAVPPTGQQLKAKPGDKGKPGKKAKKNRPQTMELNEVSSRPQTPQSDATSIKVESPSKSKAKTPATATKPTSPDLILPSFRGTYRMKENPSILKQVTALLLRTQQAPTKHVFLAKEPPKIKKAIAIGVHGLLPAAYLRVMLGQPTGTSIKFANLCANSIQKWADSHGCGDCVIQTVALESDGKIETRVADLWNLLQNWMNQIKAADLVVIACHSQGVPVSAMLLDKLIESGAISSARVGVCAMAGVNLGPFSVYKTSLGMLMGTAAELWDLASSESEVSKKYEAALKNILGYGARVTYVGSMDDQLVPLEVGRLTRAHTGMMANQDQVRHLLSCKSPIYISRYIHRRPTPCPRLYRPPRRVRVQAAKPGHLGPWPYPRALGVSGREPLHRRGALTAVRGWAGIRPRGRPHPRDDRRHGRRRRRALRDPKVRASGGHAVEPVPPAVDHARTSRGRSRQDGAVRRDGGAAAAVR